MPILSEKNRLRVKRVYASPTADDGYRVLVDRLWPRGESKVKADLDLWEKQIAPSTDLRKSFHAQEISYDKFMEEYERELSGNPEYADFAHLAKEKLHEGNVTLLYASKDTEHNNAEVLKEMLERTLHLSKS